MHLVMHLSMCEFCKAFEKQSAYISKQTKHFISSAELSPAEKISILKSLEK
jgi:hypothetical protein